jgi:polyketide biosynthesis enoyl-CoA hydratase PksH
MNALTIDLTAGRGRLTPSFIATMRAQLATNTDAVAIVLRGDADAFCEGLDLTMVLGEAPGSDAGVRAFGALLDALARDPRPVIAVVEGPVKAGGLGLVAVADLVIATDRATFALPETIVGLAPAVIFPFVARRIGVPRARKLALFGDVLDAAYATVWGLVDELTDDVSGALRRRLARLGRMDKRAVASVKALVAQHFAEPETYRDDAVGAFAGLLESLETRARVRRFQDGEAPWSDETNA